MLIAHVLLEINRQYTFSFTRNIKPLRYSPFLFILFLIIYSFHIT